MLYYTLIDDINNNAVYLIKSECDIIITDYQELHRIDTIDDLKKYISDKYSGGNMFDNICKLYPEFKRFKNTIINNVNNKENRERYYIASISKHKSDNYCCYYTSPVYKRAYNYKTGTFINWAKDINDDDVVYSPLGPEVVDIQISTVYDDIDNIDYYKYYYKNNATIGNIMSIDDYKAYISILNQNQTIAQVNLECADINSNQDLEAILDYSRSANIIPNIIISGALMNDKYYDILVKYCGTINILNYMNNDITIKTIFQLNDRTISNKETILNGINIYQSVSSEAYDNCINLLSIIEKDKVLKRVIDSIIFVCNVNYETIANAKKIKNLIDTAIKKNVRVKFDNCCMMDAFIKTVKDEYRGDCFYKYINRCKASLFSLYVDVTGDVYPCALNAHRYSTVGANYICNLKDFNISDLLIDIWYHSEMNAFRKQLLSTLDLYSRCGTCSRV